MTDRLDRPDRPDSSTKPRSGPPLPRLHLLEAPPGWAAALLRAEYPVPLDSRQTYALAVAELLRRIPALRNAMQQEVLLQFDRCRPDQEIPLIQANARAWLPELGLGVWLDREPPTLWTEDEFLGASPGTLRPLIYRAMKIQPSPEAQKSAWRLLLGTGTLIRIVLDRSGDFISEATDALQPRMVEPSFTSFPFYVPLLTVPGLMRPDPVFSQTLQVLSPYMGAYVRESSEDGGLLILVRQTPESLRSALLAPANQAQLPSTTGAGVELPWAFDVGSTP